MRPINLNFFSRDFRLQAEENLPSECAPAQAFLTSAFDGEEGEAALESAARHLEKCTGCASRFEEWEKTRELLRAIPAPAPPSPLLTQLLLSCRLLPADSLSVQSDLAQSETESAHLRFALMDYVQSDDDSLAAPLAQFFDGAPVPMELQNEILQLTSRAPISSRTDSRLAAALKSLLPPAAMLEWSRLWSTPGGAFPRVARWGLGAAVPALAAWLIFAGHSEYSSAPLTLIQTARIAAAPNTKPVAVKNATAHPSKRTVASVAKKILPVAPKTVSASDSDSPVFATASAPLDAPSIPATGWQNVSFPVSDSTQKKTPSAPKPPRPDLAVRSRVSPKLNFSSHARPQLISARTSLRRTSGAIHRLPRLAQHKISAPEAAPVGDEMEPETEVDFETAFAGVSSVNDNRPEDLRRAVDEYRASLLAENLDEDEDDFDDL